ncbi:hypothetical protein PF010_g2238 [Phytophthora fragariae]|uniref:Abnormal spindle-like microcephaly-associated protein ASH domain-containing protein n=1 Tax=Phytophthora fragariae TaxID=53985 RepID=A0A6A3LZI5_9STRA|nr:hypothetical protein PF011_g4988 [Phytophthora fragariae]KAE9135013.1 hypothetical protein PF010_g2238 [Phytophthora fragariae]KAE9251505.1 hypothetical protein PF004_g2447 [Phytophthora fragariae]
MAARDATAASVRNGTVENPRSPVQQRLHDGFRSDHRYLSQMVVDAQNERAARVEAVLELKQDLDASSARVAAQSATVQAQEQAEKTHQARTHQSLLDQGKNPYEVARRKVVQREARRERSKIERNIQEREAKLLGRLETEKVLQRRREKLEAEHRAYERKYQREMGRAAQEERTNAYLLSRTGKEALDPTGKLVRVYPSQETTMKDYSFGLGRSAVLSPEHRRRVVAKVLAKAPHVGTEPTALLLPRRRGRYTQQESEGQEGPNLSSGRSERDEKEDATSGRLVMPPLPSVKPGQDLHKVNHALVPSCDVKLPPIAGKGPRRSQDSRLEDEEESASGDASNATKLRKARGRSVLEERQLAKARQRQKDSRFAQSQVVWGKTFTGDAFLANPQMLWFKDFDVGRPLTLSFTLTNISNTFNQFRLLAMDDQVIELFDVVYEKPGRMSAGMSCSLRMTFTGTEGRDLDTTLSVAAPTGVFQIPVRCTCKKAVPVLNQRSIRFPEVVAGERVTIALTLANEGALPLEFQVRRLETPQSIALVDDLPVADEGQVLEASESEDVADPDDLQKDPNTSENPQEDKGEHIDQDEPAEEVVDSNNDLEEVGQQSTSASRAASAASTKMSAAQTLQLEAVEPETQEDDDDVSDPLSAEELELVERVRETTRFKPDGADGPVRFTKRGVVEPYSSSSVSFTFAPAVAMKLDKEQYVLEFPAASSCGLSSPDLRKLASISVSVSGVASEVPIFVARSRLNFRCCAYGKLYRHQLVVCNRGKVALKIQVQVPKVLANYVELTPGFGFVQASVASQEGKFPVQVKFRPEERMWKRVERAGLGSRALGMLAVPVQVVVPDQVVPVFFLLTARLTPTTLQLEVKTGSSEGGLHFGACCVGHGVSHELTISNSARVPQRVGVTSLPKDVTIADVSAGVGIVLLPGETRKLRVVYEPSFPGSLKAAGHMPRAKPVLTLWSSTFNQEYTLPCSGSGVASDLVFSHSAVRLGATALGQTQTCNVKLTNRSEHHTCLVELRLPPEAASFLRITPLVARLAPRETVRLEIDFEPTEDIFKLDRTCYLEAKTHGEVAPDAIISSARSGQADASTPLSDGPHEDVEASPVTPRREISTEPRSCHHTWTILCFHRLEGTAGGRRSTKTEPQTPLQALEVRTTVTEPMLTPSETTLDFGQVAIGQMLVRELTLELEPSATDSVWLRAQPLHVLGAFRLIGTLREVSRSSDTKKKRAFRVEFEPRAPLIYEDELELTALGVNIRVRLRGEGINPSLTLTPADGSLDFQDVLARTRSVRELVLANGSAFPLAFSIVPLDDMKAGTMAPGAKEEDSMTTSTGLPVFTFSPTNAIIPENGSVMVQVVFQPDHQRPGHYAKRYRVKVPNESEQHIVSLAGRCWENQLYVFAPTADPSPLPSDSDDTDAGLLPRRPPLLALRPVENLFDLPPSVPLSQLPSSLGAGDLPVAGLRKPLSSFVLTFAGDETNSDTESGWTKTLFVGSTTPSSGIYGGLDEVPAGTSGGSVGSFELVVDAASPHAKMFTLEPARGAIAAGQQLAIQVTHHPPAPATASDTSTPSSSARSTVSTTSARAKSAQRRPELEVFQWVQVRVQCTLKGGALWQALPAAGAAPVPAATSGIQQKGAAAASDGADTCIVAVILRARLET